MSRLARLSSYKDGRAPSTTVKKLGFTTVRRLVRLKTMLYGYVWSLYGILPCLTAPSRIISVRLRMPCGSLHKTCLLSGQRKHMLVSQSTNPRLMGLDITTMIYFPAPIERGIEVFPYAFVGLGALQGVREPLGEISYGDVYGVLALWLRYHASTKHAWTYSISRF
jgi:hypothetical protein